MVKMVDLVGLQVDLGGFAPNVCNVVTALSLETAFMPGGNPKVFLCFPRAKGTPLDASSGRISAKGPPHDSCARPVRIQFFDVI